VNVLVPNSNQLITSSQTEMAAIINIVTFSATFIFFSHFYCEINDIYSSSPHLWQLQCNWSSFSPHIKYFVDNHYINYNSFYQLTMAQIIKCEIDIEIPFIIKCFYDWKNVLKINIIRSELFPSLKLKYLSIVWMKFEYHLTSYLLRANQPRIS